MIRIFKSIVKSVTNLSKFERILWAVSVAVVTVSMLASGNPDALIFLATLTGVTALIFIARGDVLGQILIIIFSTLYAAVSFRFAYYGEMISYVFMSGGVALLSTVTWLRHPFSEKQVRISHPSKRALAVLGALTVTVTVIFYFLLKLLGTSNLPFSTVSIATSFVASSLTLLRSPYYALAYALNDVVLIVLWVCAAVADPSSIPMIPCFAMFLINDLYGFFNWLRMEKQQKKVK